MCTLNEQNFVIIHCILKIDQIDLIFFIIHIFFKCVRGTSINILQICSGHPKHHLK